MEEVYLVRAADVSLEEEEEEVEKGMVRVRISKRYRNGVECCMGLSEHGGVEKWGWHCVGEVVMGMMVGKTGSCCCIEHGRWGVGAGKLMYGSRSVSRKLCCRQRIVAAMWNLHAVLLIG
jgi:hypothetical protein